MKKIDYSKPYISSREKASVAKAISNGLITGDGKLCKLAEEKLSSILNNDVFLTTSGTHALELALMALGIKHGDEVICPSFTFVSTANAIVRQGARPVFAEVETRTLNIDIDDLVKKITAQTKAVIPVHYAGFSCDMERLRRICGKRGIFIVEDAAQAIGAKYNGKNLGTFGQLGCFSFHSTKNITCGEGGAIVCCDKSLINRIRIIREKGTNRFLYLKGLVHKYSWVDVGSSYVVSDILAAFLLPQLNKLKQINRRRVEIFNYYMRGLKGLEEKGYIILPKPDERSESNGHIFWVLLARDINRSRVIKAMKKNGIECTLHYVPLHNSPYGVKHLGYKTGDFPVTEDISERMIRLPLHVGLKDKDVEVVVENFKNILDEIPS